jgi:hypothetical protein
MKSRFFIRLRDYALENPWISNSKKIYIHFTSIYNGANFILRHVLDLSVMDWTGDPAATPSGETTNYSEELYFMVLYDGKFPALRQWLPKHISSLVHQ